MPDVSNPVEDQDRSASPPVRDPGRPQERGIDMDAVDLWILVGTIAVVSSPFVFFSEWWNRLWFYLFPLDPDDDWPGDIR
jgi:hypothetical protein